MWLLGVAGLQAYDALAAHEPATQSRAFPNGGYYCLRDGWTRADVPQDDLGTVGAGARHFVRCLLGDETPVLTAEHARHVLDITLKAYASIADGASHLTETTF